MIEIIFGIVGAVGFTTWIVKNKISKWLHKTSCNYVIRFCDNFYKKTVLLEIPLVRNINDTTLLQDDLCNLCQSDIFSCYMNLCNVEFIQLYNVEDDYSLLDIAIVNQHYFTFN
jgi:hypothetical protein